MEIKALFVNACIKCECYGCLNLYMVMGLPENKCFRLIKNVGVNRAPVRIRLSGRVGDSDRDTFENKILIKRNKCFD